MRLLAVTMATLTLGSTLAAQADAVAQTAALVAPPQPEGYAYQPDGRRDPFLSLINAGTDTKALKRDGLRTFSLAEISVRGVVQSRDALVAMVQGPDNKTYLIHQGDKLADAVVKNVTTQGLIVMQDISDPLSVQKQREVRKLLRSLEGAEK
jgi:Tfp pilus assembly protein PilP